MKSKKKDSSMLSRIEEIHIFPQLVTITGWAASAKGEEVGITLVRENGEPLDIAVRRLNRSDITSAGYVPETALRCGFQVDFARETGQGYVLILDDGTEKKRYRFHTGSIKRKQKVRTALRLVRKAGGHVNAATARELFGYVRENGVKNLKGYVLQRAAASGKPYRVWFEEHRPSKEQLAAEQGHEFPYSPKISIIVPTYRTPAEYLHAMVDSVREQSYENWELCIADGSEDQGAVAQQLRRFRKRDGRIRYTVLEKNLGIAGNTNAALALAEGEYIGFLDHDDKLAPNALYEIAAALQEKRYDMLYTDEDKITEDGKEHLDPSFKPDFSPDLLCSHNYITHFMVVKAEILQRIGGFRKEYDGAQDYDLTLRCAEQAQEIRHIPKILYHWRIHENSVAGNSENKLYAYESGRRAIEDHLKRVHLEAEVNELDMWGMYRVKYRAVGEPLISVIIPNKDHTEDLDRCLESLYSRSSYRNFEIIVVENNSEKQETFEYYDRLQKQHESVRVVTWKEGFNFSAVNNYGVRYAKGEYLLFLNNDTELISEGALEEMLGLCMRKDMGVVGAKLLYADGTVQHAGVVIGFGNYAGHVNTNIGRNECGYMNRARINCNYSAVTAACMMTPKELFEELGGFDEQFEVACNDVDYCLRVRETGKWVVYNAFAEWYHFESKSRGYEDTVDKVIRFDREIEKFGKRWGELLEKGDPFYNVNFPLTGHPFTLG